MVFDKETVESIKNAEKVEEGPEYTIVDKVRISNDEIRPFVEYMTGSRITYLGDIAFGVKSVSEFYKKLRGVEKPKVSKRFNYPVD